MKVYCALVYFLKVQKYHCSVKNNLRSSDASLLLANAECFGIVFFARWVKTTQNIANKKMEKVVELVGRGSVINGAYRTISSCF